MPSSQTEDLASELASVRTAAKPTDPLADDLRAVRDPLAADLEAVRRPHRPAPFQVGGVTDPGSVKIDGVPTWDALRSQFKTEPKLTVGDATLDDALRRGASDPELETIAKNQQLLKRPAARPLEKATPPPIGIPPEVLSRDADTAFMEHTQPFVQGAIDTTLEGPPQVLLGLKQAGEAAAANDKTLTPKAGPFLTAGHNIMEGGFKTLTPLVIAHAVADPFGTAAVLGAAHYGSKYGSEASRQLGFSPEASQFAGDLAAIIAGTFGAKAYGLGAETLGRVAEGGPVVKPPVDPFAEARASAAAVLGLDNPEAPQDEVQAAYRAAAKKVHPDQNPNANPDDIKNVNLAYEWLTDHPGTGKPKRMSWRTWAENQVEWLKSKLSGPEAPASGPNPPPVAETPPDQRLLNARPEAAPPPPAAPPVVEPPPAPPEVTAQSPTAPAAPEAPEVPVGPALVKVGSSEYRLRPDGRVDMVARNGVTTVINPANPDVFLPPQVREAFGMMARETSPVTTTLEQDLKDVRGEEPDAPAPPVEPPSSPEARPGTEGAGVQPEGGSPVSRRRGESLAAAHERVTLDGLIGDARAGGYTGDVDALRKELADRLQLVKDLDAEFETNGRNPDHLLKAIASVGGISLTKETGNKGEINRLMEFQDQKFSKSKKKRGNLADNKLTIKGQVRGVKGVFNDDGLPLDSIVEALGRAKPEFRHITDITALLNEIEHAVHAAQPEHLLDRFVEGLGFDWWQRIGRAPEEAIPEAPPEDGDMHAGDEGDISFDPDELARDLRQVRGEDDEPKFARRRDTSTPDLFAQDLEEVRAADVNEFGEEQPRLPGAGEGRDTNVQPPEFEAPFSLTSEVARPRKGKQDVLFSKREPAPVFFSGLTRAAENLKQAKGTALDVTTQMREAALEGLPLFARDALRPLGESIPLDLIRAAKKERDLVERTYRNIQQPTIGGRQMAVIDSGGRYTPEELAALFTDPDFARVAVALTDLIDDIVKTVLGEAGANIEARGLVLDARTYGVFVPKPFRLRAPSEARKATILLNSFELMLGKVGTPQSTADRAFITAVHEALHWHIGSDGPHFEAVLARQLEALGAEKALAASARIMEAYADPDDPTKFRGALARLLSEYQESRRRRPRHADALSRQGSRSERRPTETGRARAPTDDLQKDRDRTVSPDELARLAELKGTTVDEQAARAVEAGYTIQSTFLPGGKEFLEQDVIPGLKAAAQGFVDAGEQLRRAVAPSTVGTGEKAAGALRAKGGREAQENARMMRAAEQFQRQFDALLKTPNGEEKAVEWWDAVQAGKPTKILPELQAAYEYMRRELDGMRDQVQEFGKLEQFNAFYFPQIWKFPKEDAQWVRRKIAGLLGKRPFEGSKGFTKQRTYPTFREGLDALLPRGIKPISYNPVDHFLVKMREMRRYAAARRAIRDFEDMGIWKPYGGQFGKLPEDWRRIEGALGTIYGPRTVDFEEGFDPDLMKGLNQLGTDLGVNLSRGVKQPAGRGVGKAWGLAYGDKAIWTKAAGPETVLMHEIGHIIDTRYGLWDKIIKPAPIVTRTISRGKNKGKVVKGPAPQHKSEVKARATIKKELSALADLRFEGMNVSEYFKKYVREGPEKMANMVHAFIWNPERMKEVAPNTYWALFNISKEHEALAPLRTLQKTRSLKLGSRAHQIDIGGFPELGYYAMPVDAARIFNNHLSSGLAGRSAVFDAYRWLNNSMVTGQLAASGLLHFTFTSINMLASEGALALQEMVRGAETGDWKLAATGLGRGAKTTALGVAGAAAGYTLGGPAGILWASGFPLAALKFIKGWRGRRAWLTEDPAGRFIGDHVRSMQEAGFRPTWEGSLEDNSSMATAMRALRTGNWPGALARAVPAAFDAVSAPVMRVFVPAMKTAAFMDSAAFALTRLQPEVERVNSAERLLASLPKGKKARKMLTPEQQQIIRNLEAQRADDLSVIRKALGDVQASMDNRFGEVVYANWFWQGWLKDLMHVMLRSPGWQAGTYKELGGAVIAQTGNFAEAMQRIGGGGGKGPGGKGKTSSGGKDLGPIRRGSRQESLLAMQMAWLLALIGVVMMQGGMTHYMSTGEKPKSLKDYFYPKGPDGNRRATVSYLRTIVSAYLHPIRTIGGITAPINNALFRLLATNETYNGEVIREPGDPWFTDVYNVAKFLAKEGYQPFIYENITRGEGNLESTFGVSPAPAEMQRSAAENYLREALPPSPPRTHAQQKRLEAVREFRKDIKAGDREGAKAIAKETGLNSQSIRSNFKRARQENLVNMFTAATFTQALRAYEIAEPEERYALKPLLAKKAYGGLQLATPADREALRAQFKNDFSLPVAKPSPTGASAK